MKNNKSKFILLWAILVSSLLSFVTLVRAADYASTSPSWAWFEGALGTLFGLGFPTVSWTEIVVVCAVFLMLFFAFSDIIANFSGFTPWVAWFIGGGLAIIAALTRSCLVIAHLLMSILAWAGTFTVFFAVAVSFLVFFAEHFLLAKFALHAMKAKANMQATKQSAEAQTEAYTAATGLRAFSKGIRGKTL